jgi:hypothetical protein
MRYLGEDEVTQMMGLGSVGEVRRGPDGNLYQWVQGVDGLGNPIGSWKKWAHRLARRAVNFIPAVAALRAARPLLRKVLPIAQRFAPLIPGGAAVAAGLRVAKAAGVAGADGLGALYQAPDGTVYQVQGLAEDEELRGLAEDEELRGIAEEEELRGLAEDEELQGLAEDEDLQGYVREDGVSGVEAYVPNQPASTRWFTRPAQPPEMWKPMW